MTDEEGIRRTLADYCHFFDDGRFEEFSQLFTADAAFLPLGGKVFTGPAEILAWTQDMFPDGTGMGRHLTTNVIIDVDGDTAAVRADVLMFLPSGEGPLPVLVARYYDTLAREADRWRFSRREVIVATQDLIGPALGATATGPYREGR